MPGLLEIRLTDREANLLLEALLALSRRYGWEARRDAANLASGLSFSERLEYENIAKKILERVRDVR
jgi:hypothetical protein